MLRRTASILLLATFIAQAMLGGLRGEAVLCLGHADHAEAASAEAQGPTKACSGCDHHTESPLPRAVEDDHGEGCGCVDVRLSLCELLAGSRRAAGDGAEAASMTAAPAALLISTTAIVSPAVVPPRARPSGDPWLCAQLTSVRTVRLLV